MIRFNISGSMDIVDFSIILITLVTVFYSTYYHTCNSLKITLKRLSWYLAMGMGHNLANGREVLVLRRRLAQVAL